MCARRRRRSVRLIYVRKTSEDSGLHTYWTLGTYYRPAVNALVSLPSTTSSSPLLSFFLGFRGAAQVHYRGPGSELRNAGSGQAFWLLVFLCHSHSSFQSADLGCLS